MENTLQIGIYRKMLPKKRKYSGHSLAVFPSLLLRFSSLLTNCVLKVHFLPQPCAKRLLRQKLEFKQTNNSNNKNLTKADAHSDSMFQRFQSVVP